MQLVECKYIFRNDNQLLIHKDKKSQNKLSKLDVFILL